MFITKTQNPLKIVTVSHGSIHTETRTHMFRCFLTFLNLKTHISNKTTRNSGGLMLVCCGFVVFLLDWRRVSYINLERRVWGLMWWWSWGLVAGGGVVVAGIVGRRLGSWRDDMREMDDNDKGYVCLFVSWEVITRTI